MPKTKKETKDGTRNIFLSSETPWPTLRPPSVLDSGYRKVLCQRQSGRGVKLATHHHLVPKLGMSGCIPLLHPYSYKDRTGTTSCNSTAMCTGPTKWRRLGNTGLHKQNWRKHSTVNPIFAEINYRKCQTILWISGLYILDDKNKSYQHTP